MDANGYWITETLPPARANRVTCLYDDMGLAGQVHHLSGAALAERILAEEGLPAGFVAAVAEAIRAHVPPVHASPQEKAVLYETPEARCLYDADLIDANLGLVAFYRNIQIHAGRMVAGSGSVDRHAYVEQVERWVGSKDTFLEQMLTPAGRDVAAARQERNRRLVDWIAEERALGPVAWQYGVLGITAWFLEDHEDPSLSRALHSLGVEWLPARRADVAADGASTHAAGLLKRSEEFHELLAAEVDGRL